MYVCIYRPMRRHMRHRERENYMYILYFIGSVVMNGSICGIIKKFNATELQFIMLRWYLALENF